MLFVAEAPSFSYNAGSSIRVLSECVYIYLNSEKVGYAFACAVVPGYCESTQQLFSTPDIILEA